MRRFLSLPLFASLLVSGLVSAFASDLARADRRLNAIFAKSFDTHYEEGRCGSNILGLLDAARAARVDVDRGRILSISNPGPGSFGMVNALRARGRINFHTGLPLPANTRNWYHHVVLELDCQVYDFDFTNEPRVLSLGAYLEEMFALSEGGRDDYRVEIMGADRYFAGDRGGPEKTLSLPALQRLCQ